MENYKYENAHPEKGIETSRENGKKHAFTLSCKTFRSRLLHALLRSRIARRSQTKYRIPLANDTQSFARQSAAHSYRIPLAMTPPLKTSPVLVDILSKGKIVSGQFFTPKI